MTNSKFNLIIDVINEEINHGVIEFKNFGSSEYYNRVYSRICGMIEVLQIMTGEKYYFDESGLHYADGVIVNHNDKEF
jgi:hypothetical protein